VLAYNKPLKINRMNIVEKAKQYAIECHRSTNHKYGKELPYEYHLNMVYEFGLKYIHLVPEEKRDIVLASCWVHDCIEDCRQTYNDVKGVLGEEVAEIAYALTNEKGKNREERANGNYYKGIRNNPFATFVKLCDRMANLSYSKKIGGSMFVKYQTEHFSFIANFYCGIKGVNVDLDIIKYKEMEEVLAQLAWGE